MKKFIIAIFIIASSFTFAQQSYFELLRQDLGTKKVALITEVMQFTDQEAEVSGHSTANSILKNQKSVMKN